MTTTSVQWVATLWQSVSTEPLGAGVRGARRAEAKSQACTTSARIIAGHRACSRSSPFGLRSAASTVLVSSHHPTLEGKKFPLISRLLDPRVLRICLPTTLPSLLILQ